jgi:hypothetical protein
MTSLKYFNALCTPAQLYLGLSLLSILSMCFQNTDPNIYACGLWSAKTPINNLVYFAFKLLYIVGWTYLLNIFCKKGYNKLSWLLVLLPLVAMFLLIGLVIVSLKSHM